MADGLMYSGIPLGGLGTGSVELRADGYFREWQIMNNYPWGAGPEVRLPLETFFFGIHVDSKARSHTAILGRVPDNSDGRNPFLNDPYRQPWLRHASRIQAETQVPFTRLKYFFDEMPVMASLEAFSPFMPLDAKNSALPLAAFRITITNPGDQELRVTLFSALRNLVGYDQPQTNSIMRFCRTKSGGFILYGREKLKKLDPTNGTLAMGVSSGPGQTTAAMHLRTSRDLYDPLRATGRLENANFGVFGGNIGDAGAHIARRTRHGTPFGAVAHTFTLRPKATQDVVLQLAWHFPNMRDSEYRPGNVRSALLGHQYARWFTDAAAVFRYGASNATMLEQQTRAFVEAYYRSDLPEWALHAIAAQFTTLVKASWWDKRGRFGIWEGLGCCGLQTTDITYYASFPIAQFFPELQKSQMRLTQDNMSVRGKIPHMMPGNFSCGDVDERQRIDLIPQFILLVWRDLLWTGDVEYAREMWPAVTDALQYFRRFDTDGDGLPNNKGPDQTYDQFPLRGTSAFVGFLYAGALEAAAQIAERLGKADHCRRLRDTLRQCLRKLDEQLWNGRYYRLSFDCAEKRGNEGTMTDQINADWFIRQTQQTGLLPDQRAREVLKAIVKYCSEPDGFIANCHWPKGKKVEIGRHTSNQADCPWSGVEYALAAHLWLMGMEREGLKVVQDVWRRYERAGMRFNHIECGEHYYRALSSWAVYLAWAGYWYDRTDATLTLRLDRDRHFVLNTADGWGEAAVTSGRTAFALKLRKGVCHLRQLVLLASSAGKVACLINGKRVPVSIEPSHTRLRVVMKKRLALAAGERLEVRTSGC